MYCGKKLEMAYFDVDHKTPFSRNGSEGIKNKQLLCRPCNTRKGDLTDGEFRRAYKLTPARQAEGPPTKVIPQKYFEEMTKERARKRRTRSNADDWW